ncbi:MAG: hypothetical protein KF893_24655 [Caldilineaceae bacterium]|nr:hypothetical protein [Caldilineaceae bacterium]
MQPSQMLTPQMVDLILPTLGFSLILNVFLLVALLFRSIRRWTSFLLQTYWIGLQMLRQDRRQG